MFILHCRAVRNIVIKPEAHQEKYCRFNVSHTTVIVHLITAICCMQCIEPEGSRNPTNNENKIAATCKQTARRRQVRAVVNTARITKPASAKASGSSERLSHSCVWSSKTIGLVRTAKSASGMRNGIIRTVSCSNTGHMPALCRMRTRWLLYTRRNAQATSPPAPDHRRNDSVSHPIIGSGSPSNVPHHPYLKATARLSSIPWKGEHKQTGLISTVSKNHMQFLARDTVQTNRQVDTKHSRQQEELQQ